jgi:hypothetical protein
VAYPIARRKLIAQGFTPVKVLDRNDSSWWCDARRPLCRVFPEVIACTAAGSSYCNFLYRQQGAGKYWIVSIAGDEGQPPDFRRFRCCGYRIANKYYLENLVIADSDGRPFRFRYRYPPQKDTTPLCSETPDGKDCWVKPPAGYRSPRQSGHH